MLALILGIATAGQVHNEDVSLGQGWREAVAGSWLLETRRDELTKALEGRPGRSAPAVSGDLLCVVDADCTDGRSCGDTMRCRK